VSEYALSAKCVFFVFVEIRESEEHHSDSAKNYSHKHRGAPETPIR